MSIEEINLTTIIKAPIITEKASIKADEANQFVFKVKNSATKLNIKKAVELMFDVKVDSVRVLNVKGKSKRF